MFAWKSATTKVVRNSFFIGIFVIFIKKICTVLIVAFYMLQKGSNKESVNVPSFLIRHLGTSTMGLTFKF